MDPNATLNLINEAIAEGDIEAAREACDNLRNWLRRGGFAPNWSAYPDATKFFNA